MTLFSDLAVTSVSIVVWIIFGLIMFAAGTELEKGKKKDAEKFFFIALGFAALAAILQAVS